MSHTIRIVITDHDTQNVTTRLAYSDRDDWSWMLNEFANAVNGAGYSLDPYNLYYGENDSVTLAFSEPFHVHIQREGTD